MVDILGRSGYNMPIVRAKGRQMKVKQLIARLEKLGKQHGNVEVMFSDPNDEGSVYSINFTSREVADEDEYPDDWGMPEGFKFILLRN
jgi:hypothetical protein